MSDESAGGMRQELLDDFYAECDELLSTMRRCLDSLESAGPEGTAAAASTEELFRAMHTLKGIAAIAGVSPAEESAHACEDVLRALTKGILVLSPTVLDHLAEAVEQLNKLIAAHRKGRKLPQTATIRAKLSELLKEGRIPESVPATASRPASVLPVTPATAAAKGDDPVLAARARGLKIWRVIFAPSAALDQRGVKINTVRERLGQVGEILNATPVVQATGLRFIFTFAAKETPENLAAWEADGIAFEPLESSPLAKVAVPAAPEPVADPVPADTENVFDLSPSHLVRVDLGQLDDLMRITGEIIIHRSRLQDRLGQRDEVSDELKEIDQALARSLRELRTAVSRVRLVPVAEIFSRMPYVLRDLVRDSAKRARIVLQGEQTEIDKYLVERLKEPLLHLVRNAFAHAIELPAEREKAGKPATATIHLRARRVGDSVEIQVADDGRGIDAQAVATRATALGLSLPAVMDSTGLLNVLCQPGFSTRDTADRSAGRGVGMAVVSNTVRELGGTLRLQTRPGHGSEFTLRLPLSLSIADALIVKVGSQHCAVPQGHVDEIFQVAAAESRSIQDTEVVPYRGALLPVVRLRIMFGVPEDSAPVFTVVVVSSDRGATGLVVDGVLSRREIVIRTLTDPLVRAPGISGATELGDGRPILVLDAAAITAGVVRPHLESLTPSSPAS